MTDITHHLRREDTALPLQGILVVALEQAVAAPLCTARLSDAGARVIKIERSIGDFARGYDEAALGDSSYFVWANHGKESLTLNIKEHKDAALLHRILDSADVFIQNLAPGAASRAGFGSKELRKRYPSLVTCDISGYGDSDALSDMKAYDLLVQAESGLVSVSGSADEYGRIGVSLCDIGAGVTAHSGILEALYLRSRTGVGSGISVSLFDVAAEWMSVPLIHAETGNGAPPRVGLRHPSIAPYGAYPSSDKKLTVISIQNEREWKKLCESVLQNATIATDERFISNVFRVKHREQLEVIIGDITRQLSSQELRQRLRHASIAYGAINSVEELSTHNALRRRTVINSHDHEVSLPAHPVANSHQTNTTKTYRSPTVPKIGQHTEMIRAEFSREEEIA